MRFKFKEKQIKAKFAYAQAGFTVTEALIAVVVVIILGAISVPAMSKWLPNYRLSAAARELYSDMHLTKLGAIKQNRSWAIVFYPSSSPGEYYICSDPGADGIWNGPSKIGGDDVVEKEVFLPKNVNFGCVGATTGPDGGALPGNGISYSGNVATFNPTGLGSSGYVFLANQNGRTCAVGSLSSGVILFKKWNGSSWEDE